MNFTDMIEKHFGASPERQEVIASAQKFDMGSWKDLPPEMVSFGGMLLQDGVFRLPFIYCLFGADHDFIDNQFSFPEGMDRSLEDPSLAGFPWRFERNPALDDCQFMTKSIFVEAFDLSDDGLEPARLDYRRRLREEGDVEMNVDFAFAVIANYGRNRGYEHAGTMVVDQGGEFFWVPISPVVQNAAEKPGDADKNVRLAYFFSYAMGYFALNAVLASVASLASKSTKQEVVHPSEKLNRARVKRGKLPIYEYRRVLVGNSRDMPRTISGKSIEGRSSPRLHWRRGHYRTLASNIRVPVAPAIVGLAENGIIDKEYVFEKISGQPR